MIDVTSYGAVGDWNGSSGTDNKGPIENAIAAANAAGDEIYFPPGKYWLNAPVDKSNLSNLRFYGKGAIIICQGTTGTGPNNHNGWGGGFYLAGNKLIIEELQFIGFTIASGSTTNGYGRLLMLVGNFCVVKNCNFSNGNGGAVEITGNYNIISRNTFYACNNFPPGGTDYGSIQVVPSSQYNTISENKIYEHDNAGICGYGTGVSYLDILNNYIRSNSSVKINDHSMGIFLLSGANRNIKIIGNTIEKQDAEGIVIFTDTTFPASECTIADNIIRDCAFRGISLEQDSNSGTFIDFIITGNIIENTLSQTSDFAHQIWLNAVQDSNISKNKCIGYGIDLNEAGLQGINLYNYCPRNQISDNQLRDLNVGIIFYSPDGALKDNHIYNCSTGIQIGNCLGASIVGNFIKGCTTGINYTTDSSPLHIVGNAVLECFNRYGFISAGSIVPEILTHSGRADSGSNIYSSFIVIGTLSSGVATVAFNTIYSGDRFIVVPNNESGDTQGAIYVSLIDVVNSQVTVRSTLGSSDNRSFTLIKAISADSTYLVTESGDHLQAETGDYLITET